MTFSTASAIKGMEYPASLQRIANAALAPGRSGVLGVNDLYVRGLGAAGVSIDPGAAIMQNLYEGTDSRQAYVAENDSTNDDATVSVPAAGSGSQRVDYLILRIYDTTYAGQTDPTGKGCGPVLVSSLPTAYPYVTLAKITQPAGNTAGIQQSMVDNSLRVVANPRQLTVTRSFPLVTADTGLVLNNDTTTGEWFPNGLDNSMAPFIDIPDWAVRVDIKCTWIGVRYASGSNPWGACWVEWGPVTTGNQREKSIQKFGFDSAGPHTSNYRANWVASQGSVYVPAAYRGTSQRFVPFASYSAGAKPAAGSLLQMDAYSGIEWVLTFYEVAEDGANW